MSPQSDSDPEAKPLVASYCRGMDFGREWSPSPIRQKCQVTFALEKAPSPVEGTRPTDTSCLLSL